MDHSLPAHGGDTAQLAREAGCAADALYDASVNVNPLGPPPWLRAEIGAGISWLARYPDPHCLALRQAAAARYACPADHFLAGNGSADLMYLATRLPGYRRAVIPQPAYGDYARATRAAGLTVQNILLRPEESFALDMDALATTLGPEPAMVFLGQPANPSGRTFPAQSLRRWAASRPDCLFLVDEAFADFVPGLDRLTAQRPDNVLTFLSLTKFYAVPGLRLGLLCAAPELVRRLAELAPPWQVSGLAQAVGARALADADYARRTLESVPRWRRELRQALDALPGLTLFPGEANFLLARVDRPGLSAQDLFHHCLGHRVAIRRCGNFPGLDPRYFRVAVGTQEGNARLVAALGSVLGVSRKPRRRRPTPALMVQGATSNAGKSVLATALCRILLQDGFRVAPFKAQNMALNSYVTDQGLEMGRAQATQAAACRLPPDARMNPVLLKPTSDVGSQVIVLGRPVGVMRVAAYVRYKPTAWKSVVRAYEELRAEHDVMVLEGAGSPAEINLKHHDLVNMAMARHANARVLLAADIDRGGAYAALLGTMDCLDEAERRLVVGFVLNKFRGDASLLGPGNEELLARTGVPVVGVVPHLARLGLPEEDSVSFKARETDTPDGRERVVDIALIDLPHIANFTDYDALAQEPDVRLRPVVSAQGLGRPDAILLPGSKNTLADLAWLRREGLHDAILALSGQAVVVGVCGGLQMLGSRVADPHGLESGLASQPGLGLLPLETVLEADKVLTRRSGRFEPWREAVHGYEIHHGRTVVHGQAVACVVDATGQPLGWGLPGGRVWATYLHGIFDADGFRRRFVDELRRAKGLPGLGRVVAPYDLEPALDRLAEVVRQRLDIPALYARLGLDHGAGSL